MTYEAIRAECDELGMGPLLWQRLVEVAARVARRYPPDPYNHGEPWSEEAHRDLALEVSLERLLAENQLEYVLATAAEHPPEEREDALARLLAFQVRRVLNHRRTITVVDRLHSRVKSLVGSDEFDTARSGGDLAVSLPEAGAAAPRVLAEQELHQGVQLIASIPRLPSRPDAERESKVYTAADLRELVGRLVAAFGTILLSDIRRILEITLTAWLPTVLRDHEEDSDSRASPDTELERTLMNQLVASLARAFDPMHRAVLLGKSQGISDGDLARRFDRSRPWIADRKTEVLARVQTELIENVPDVLHDEAVRQLLDAVTALEEVDS
jgi:hypothetical protein